MRFLNSALSSAGTASFSMIASMPRGIPSRSMCWMHHANSGAKGSGAEIANGDRHFRWGCPTTSSNWQATCGKRPIRSSVQGGMFGLSTTSREFGVRMVIAATPLTIRRLHPQFSVSVFVWDCISPADAASEPTVMQVRRRLARHEDADPRRSLTNVQAGSRSDHRYLMAISTARPAV